MAYHLLTGATGLLGSYLVRDLLDAGHRLAVLVRPTKRESARHRIESLLARLELETGDEYVRPVVLEANLDRPHLGLDETARRWITRHCEAVIHNAASLTLHGRSRKGEPWITNVEGTRRMLQLCADAGIREFHYVSTAYVCGVRRDAVLECQLDVGQKLRNDYERSKIEAEKLVHAAHFLDSRTIYRPAVIVGDSQTGFASTFNGFYALLKLVHTLVSKVFLGATGSGLLIKSLGLNGSERTNLVPVDWVSAVISHIVGQPEHHGRTYHLVNSRPTPAKVIGQVIQEVVEDYSRFADTDGTAGCDGGWLFDSMRRGMQMYRDYCGDDPNFDDTNRALAAPHLVCPEIDAVMLRKLSKAAVLSHFGRAGRRVARPELDVQTHLRSLAQQRWTPLPDLNGSNCLGLVVRGPGGGQWKLMLRHGRLVDTEDGLGPECSATFYLDVATFQRLAAGQLDAGQAVRSGRVLIEGNSLDEGQLLAVLQGATGGALEAIPSA